MSNESQHDDDLSPAEIARLASWFGEGGTAQNRSAEFDAPKKAVARSLEGVDEHLQARLWRRVGDAEPLLRVPPPLPSRIKEDISTFDLDAGKLRFSGDPREYELPDELLSDMADNTPQALLRDLHRPQAHFGTVAYTALEVGYDSGAKRSRAMVVDALRADYRAHMGVDETLRPVIAMRRELSEARQALAAPWEALGRDRRPDDGPPSGDVMAIAQKWFG